MYLVDTNILSAGAPAARVSRVDLTGWMDRASPHLFLSVVTATEIIDGIHGLRRKGATRKAAIIGEWWETVTHLYGARILPFDLAAAALAGQMMDRARGAGYEPGLADIAIAATASTKGLTVLTRNVRDFAPLGVAFHDPYEVLPVLPPP